MVTIHRSCCSDINRSLCGGDGPTDTALNWGKVVNGFTAAQSNCTPCQTIDDASFNEDTCEAWCPFGLDCSSYTSTLVVYPSVN